MILAGGRSSRFGTDKAMALWRGRTFLERVAEALGPHTDRLRVLARADHAERYARLIPGAEILPDPEAFDGPVAALRSGLPASGRVVVASVDAPGLQPSHVAALLAAAEGGMAVATDRDGLLPTLMAGSADAFHAVLPGSRRLRDLSAGARPVLLTGEGLNVNRPEEVPTDAR